MKLAGFIARRLLRVVAVVVVVTMVAWLLVEAAPGSPGERAARAAGVLPPADQPAGGEGLRDQLIHEVAREHGLNRSLAGRLTGYLGDLLRFDLGRSWRDGEPVTRHLGRSAPATLILVIVGLLLALVGGVFAGVISARRPGGVVDLICAVAAALAFAAPPVWVAIVGLRAFAAGHPLSWLPSGGLDSAAAAILPLFTITLVPIFMVARHVRAGLIENLGAPWAIAARARGASRDRVMVVHVLRVVLPALAPLIVVTTAYLLGASLVVEEVFAIRGLGSLVVDASARGDGPVVVGVSVVAATILAMVSALTDLLRRLTDPREEG